jgi:hypothetical protein
MTTTTWPAIAVDEQVALRPRCSAAVDVAGDSDDQNDPGRRRRSGTGNGDHSVVVLHAMIPPGYTPPGQRAVAAAAPVAAPAAVAAKPRQPRKKMPAHRFYALQIAAVAAAIGVCCVVTLWLMWHAVHVGSHLKR